MELVANLREGAVLALTMGWESWWALVLGFTIAGAVESFVSEEQMAHVLGGHGFRELGLGTLFGAASSSCSFGAVATTKSLFKKGASPVASLAAFQFASTNLVIELGLVMWVLLGWRFVAANFAAGLILIVLLAGVFHFVVPDDWFEYARSYLREREGVRDPVCGMEVDPTTADTITLETPHGTEYFCSETCRERFESRDEASGLRDKLTTRRGWTAAFRNAVGEWQMLWKDIVAGFVIAGLIGAFVPRIWWTTLFEFGSTGTFWWVLYTATVGVTVGVITFVCSVGNVPFAVILWQNGIAFGAVMSFIFADLIVPNIDDAYRRYYGWRMAATLFASIFVTSVASGVTIHYVWDWIGLMPPPASDADYSIHASRSYVTYLNIGFTVLFAAQLYATFGPDDSAD